jgi:hypothetical protein
LELNDVNDKRTDDFVCQVVFVVSLSSLFKVVPSAHVQTEFVYAGVPCFFGEPFFLLGLVSQLLMVLCELLPGSQTLQKKQKVFLGAQHVVGNAS